jgi:peptidoglycan/xylan/chitin deacetylase (PgdA/CDA1 family)
MLYKAKRFRLKMLGWLFIPALLLVFLSAQLIKTVETFATTLHDKAKHKQIAEGDISTTIPEIPPFVYQNTGLVTLWFDDAWESQYSIGLTTLDKYNFKGALAVPTKAVETYQYMTWLQVKRMQHKGWEITAHSRIHNCNMQKANQALINSEVLGSQTDLRSRGFRSDIYVTPCGVSNSALVSTVRKSFPEALRTSDPGLNPLPMPYSYDIQIIAITNKTTKQDIVNILAQAKASRTWAVFTFHRLDNGTQEYDTDQKHFEAIIEAVYESGLPVVLPTQVLRIPGTGKLNRPIDVDAPDIDVPVNESFEDTQDLPDTSNEDNDATSAPTPVPTVIPLPTAIITQDPSASDSASE